MLKKKRKIYTNRQLKRFVGKKVIIQTFFETDECCHFYDKYQKVIIVSHIFGETFKAISADKIRLTQDIELSDFKLYKQLRIINFSLLSKSFT